MKLYAQTYSSQTGGTRPLGLINISRNSLAVVGWLFRLQRMPESYQVTLERIEYEVVQSTAEAWKAFVSEKIPLDLPKLDGDGQIKSSPSSVIFRMGTAIRCCGTTDHLQE